MIILLFPLRSEPPQSRMVNIKHVWYLLLIFRAAYDISPTTASEKEQGEEGQMLNTSTVQSFKSTFPVFSALSLSIYNTLKGL